MNQLASKRIATLLSMMLGLSSVSANAAVLTESLKDKLKCGKVDGEKVCSIETRGQYNLVAKISGQDLQNAELTPAQISEESTIEIALADFVFSSSMANADRFSANGSKLVSRWTETTERCIDAECNKIKLVRHATIQFNANNKGAVLKVFGSSLNNDNDSYGYRILSDLCDQQGDGTELNETATLTIDGKEISATFTGICKVKTKSVTKNGETFELWNSRITAKD
ncbi:hypothetical protein [Methylomonas rhizoryzae]|uniref:hypothetical protein n=1 Tax=Methylomonas rhizoryzae TaxID=2608981 RepID=UPI0012325927|nr:hypothetical protein [Methylomonas rhizoryzae]